MVDAHSKGSKMKFVNHNSKSPTCEARIMLVNGDFRIAVYAARYTHTHTMMMMVFVGVGLGDGDGDCDGDGDGDGDVQEH